MKNLLILALLVPSIGYSFDRSVAGTLNPEHLGTYQLTGKTDQSYCRNNVLTIKTIDTPLGVRYAIYSGDYEIIVFTENYEGGSHRIDSYRVNRDRLQARIAVTDNIGVHSYNRKKTYSFSEGQFWYSLEESFAGLYGLMYVLPGAADMLSHDQCRYTKID